MDNNKLIKQIVIIILIIFGFILFNYSFYNLVTKTILIIMAKVCKKNL